MTLAVVLLDDLFPDNRFDVDSPRGEVGQNFRIEKDYVTVIIVPVVRPDGGEVQLRSEVQILVVGAYQSR